MRESGFTILELLIVSAIIGILAALAVPNYTMFKRNAHNASAESDVRNLATAADFAFGKPEGPGVYNLTGNGGELSPPIEGGTHSPNVFGQVVIDQNGYQIQGIHAAGDVCYQFTSADGWNEAPPSAC